MRLGRLRRINVRLATAALLIGSSLEAGVAQADIPRCVSRDHWIELVSEHFTLYTNVDGSRARQYVKQLEAEADALYRRGGALGEPARGVRVYAFADRACFEAFRPSVGGKPVQLDGFNVGGANGSYLAFNASLPASEFHVVCHEYIHALIEDHLHDIPLCMNEGLAEYFSTFTIDAGPARYGHPIRERQLWVINEPLMSMDELFAVRNESDDYLRGDRRQTFYSQSWALVHFLMNEDDTRNGLERFIVSLGRGARPFTAFEACFPKLSWQTLPQQLKRYMNSNAPGFRELHLGINLASRAPRISEMPAKEVYLRLGELTQRLGTDRASEVEPFFRAALELDAGYAPALVAVAEQCDRDGRAAEAAKLFRRAVSAAGKDADVTARAGIAAVTRWFAQNSKGTESVKSAPAELLEARGWLSRSVESGSKNSDALRALVATYAFDAELSRDQLESIMRSFNAAPARSDLSADLVELLVRTHQFTLARSVFSRLQRFGSSNDVHRAQTAMLTADINRSAELAKQNRIAEAESLARAVVSQTDDPELKAFALRQLNRLTEYRSAQVAVDAYNRGVAAANRRSYAEAIVEFDRARRTTRDPKLADKAGKLALDLRERLKRGEGRARTKTR